MSNPPQPRPQLGFIDAYVPGKQQTQKAETIFRMASNENPLGTSPLAQTAFTNTRDHLSAYPDGGSYALRLAIAKKFNLPEASLVCGAGSDELLSLLALAYLDKGDEAIYTRHGFLVYPNAIRTAGATPIIAEEIGHQASVDTILANVTNKTKMVFLANPNNPTGTYLTREAIHNLHQKLPSHILLVLDAAYAEYVTVADYEAGIHLVSQADNVVMTRTFSKIYGLANLRIGWMYGPEAVVNTINTIRGPFNASGAAQMAAVAALDDEAFVKQSIDHNNHWRQWLSDQLHDLGIATTPSQGNFLLAHFPGENGEIAMRVAAALEQEGILIRGMKAYHLPNALRMSIGVEAGNLALISTLKRGANNGWWAS